MRFAPVTPTLNPRPSREALDAIRKIRNSVMHFHPDGIEPSDLAVLAKTREMLQRL